MIKTTDQIIGEFMANDAINSPHIYARNYSSDWNELHQVIEKIDSLYKEAFPTNEEFIRRILEKDEGFPVDNHYISVVALPLSSTIEEAVDAIIEFIEWHKCSTSP